MNVLKQYEVPSMNEIESKVPLLLASDPISNVV